MHMRKLVLALTLCHFLSVNFLVADDKETISLREFIELLVDSTSNEVLIERKKIRTKNPLLLKRSGFATYMAKKYPHLIDSEGYVNFNKDITIKNCRFYQNLYLHKVNFNASFTIKGSRLETVSIKDSRSQKITFLNNKVFHEIEMSKVNLDELEANNNTLHHILVLDKCTVNKSLKINNNTIEIGEIRILNSKINKGTVLIGDNKVLAEIIEGCEIRLGEYGEFNHYRLPGEAAADLYLIANEFVGDSTTRLVLNKSNYLNLDIRDNTFGINVYFIENKTAERFSLVNNTFEKPVSFDEFLFSEIWNELYWGQLAGYKLRFKDYGATVPSDFDQKSNYFNLINIYKTMHTIFLSRGDLKSANACYSEMKELQGQMHKHIYQEEPTFGNFLRWQLNVLLKIYTNHGTDPGLAVVMSFYVIVIFSLLYVFFPSEWDKDRRLQLISDFNNRRDFKGKQFVSVAFTMATTLIIVLINAVTLSINSFVTLGFGSIPTSGFARYLCIIEGFIGWFLLSIFSVALINQVLA